MLNSFVWAFIEKSSHSLFQFVSIVILGRLLSPEDYGVYGTMMIFIAISELLIDSGFGGALVQHRNITKHDINTLFVTNLSISFILYIALYVSAPSIANYYNLPKLICYLRVLGLVLVLYSLTIVHITLLQRELKFKQISRIVMISSLISVIMAVIAALLKLGVWALVIQQLSFSLAMVIILNCIDKRHIEIEFSKSSFCGLWGFGSKLLLANLLQTVYNNISTSLVPKIASMNVAGLYVQASKVNDVLINVIRSTIDRAAFPVLSKEETSMALLNRASLINQIVLSICIPLFPIISLLSIEIIYLILGKNWIGANIFMSILAWGGIGLLLQGLYRNIFKSMGNTSVILMVDIIKMVFGIVILGLSIKWGILFMIYGLTISMYFGALIYLILLCTKYKISIWLLMSEFVTPLLVSVILYFIFKFCILSETYHWYNIFHSILFYSMYFFVNYLLKNNAILYCTQMIWKRINKSNNHA